MKKLPIAIRVVLNIVFFFVYSLVGIIFGNFLFGLVLTVMGKNVPGAKDPIHMKIAAAVIIIVIIKTLLLRKYFYISLELNNKEEKKKEKRLEVLVDKEIKKGN